jgi:hypothetical protein
MPVDIDKAKENVEKASGFFETLNTFIKKHPIWSIIIAIAALSEFGYLGWLKTHDDEYYEDEYYDEYYEEGYYDGYAEDSIYYEQDYQEY